MGTADLAIYYTGYSDKPGFLPNETVPVPRVQIHQQKNLVGIHTHRRIYEYIDYNPGVHLCGLTTALNMELGTVRYHLDQLERFGKVTKLHSGGYSRYFMPGYSIQEQKCLNLAASGSRYQIILILNKNPGLTRHEISSRLEISAQAAGWHLSQLLHEGLIPTQKNRKKTAVSPDRQRPVCSPKNDMMKLAFILSSISSSGRSPIDQEGTNVINHTHSSL